MTQTIMGRMMRLGTKRAAIAALMCAMMAGCAATATASVVSRARTREGYALAYNLQFAACYDVLADASTADPLDPAPERAIAAVTWIEILFSQGVATFEAFTGEISKTDVARPPVPPTLASRFHIALN